MPANASPANFRVSEQDYVNAMRLHARPTPARLLILLTMVLVATLVAVFGAAIWSAAATGGLIGIALVAAISFTLLPRMARRHYRQYKAMHGDFALALQDDGIHFSGAHAAGTLVWDNMLKWRRNDDYVLVYVMPRLFHIVPAAIAAQGFDMPALVAQLTARLGKPA